MLQPDVTLCHCITTSLRLLRLCAHHLSAEAAGGGRGADRLFTSSQQEGWHREAGAA